MPRLNPIFPLLSFLLAMNSVAPAKSTLSRQPLPAINDPIGFAGSFAGVSNGTLLVAGGASFPERPP